MKLSFLFKSRNYGVIVVKVECPKFENSTTVKSYKKTYTEINEDN